MTYSWRNVCAPVQSAASSRFHLIYGDILDWIAGIIAGSKNETPGNLPYNISTEDVFRISIGASISFASC